MTDLIVQFTNEILFHRVDGDDLYGFNKDTLIMNNQILNINKRDVNNCFLHEINFLLIYFYYKNDFIKIK